MKGLIRAFNRVLDAELPELSPEAGRAGEMLRRFLPTLEGESLQHATTRADALRTLDEFARLRSMPAMRTARMRTLQN